MTGTNTLKKPKLEPHQFAVGQAEYATGHVLNFDKTLYLEGINDVGVFLVFNSEEEAMNYISRTIKENPDIECWLENHLGDHIRTMDKTGVRKYKN